MQTKLILQLLDFLAPPPEPEPEAEAEAEGARPDDMAQMMRYAHGWSELRRIVEMIDDQLDAQDRRSRRSGYITYIVDREDALLLLGVQRSEAGDALYITQHVTSKYGGRKRQPAKLRLLMSDIADGIAKGC